MAIAYTEKLGLHAAINAAGHWLMQRDGVWVSSDDTAVQVIINAHNPLAAQKAERIAAIKADGLVRMNAAFPAIATLDDVALLAEFWLSIAAAARAATVPFQKIITIYSAAKTAIASVNAATTKAQIDAVAPAWPA